MPIVIDAFRATHNHPHQNEQKDCHDVENYVVNEIACPKTRIIKNNTTYHIRNTVHERHKCVRYFTQNTHKTTFTNRERKNTKSQLDTI